ncbi:pulmonary surfactant-associated protein D-like, partial [Anopheles stephensi]|uniref:pulmonary surfactant-associated protein D-like n=1 Tax=Anopheles stephensi TaxID=30069 RepID=UPI00165888A3
RALSDIRRTPIFQLADLFPFSPSAGYKHYVVYRQNVNFFIATQFCRQKGGHLASIESPEESARVEAAIKAAVGNKPTVWWIGGMDYGLEGRFVWYALNKVIDYKNCNVGEPNNSRRVEDCLSVDTAMGCKRNDIPCGNAVEGCICAFSSQP